MSSVRSRSGGTSRTSRLSRKYRSSRKRPAAVSFSRFRLVVAMTRTSTRIVRGLPTRSNSFSWRTRSSLAWRRVSISLTSSRSSVPPSAISNRPMLRRSAPVNAPFSCPKSSLSRSPAERAAQLTLRNGFPCRGPRWWSSRAKSSLPVPLSPRIRTVPALGAYLPARPSASSSARLAPMIGRDGSSRPASLLKNAFSRLRRSRSRVLSTATRIVSRWNGLVR